MYTHRSTSSLPSSSTRPVPATLLPRVRPSPSTVSLPDGNHADSVSASLLRSRLPFPCFSLPPALPPEAALPARLPPPRPVDLSPSSGPVSVFCRSPCFFGRATVSVPYPVPDGPGRPWSTSDASPTPGVSIGGTRVGGYLPAPRRRHYRHPNPGRQDGKDVSNPQWVTGSTTKVTGSRPCRPPDRRGAQTDSRRPVRTKIPPPRTDRQTAGETDTRTPTTRPVSRTTQSDRVDRHTNRPTVLHRTPDPSSPAG